MHTRYQRGAILLQLFVMVCCLMLAAPIAFCAQADSRPPMTLASFGGSDQLVASGIKLSKSYFDGIDFAVAGNTQDLALRGRAHVAAKIDLPSGDREIRIFRSANGGGT